MDSLKKIGVKPALIPLVERLSRQRAVHPSLSKHHFSVDLCQGPACKRYEVPVQFPPHVKMIANWQRGPRGGIRIDRDIQGKLDRLLLGTHEVVEKTASEKYGLCPCKEAHLVADNVEKALAKRLGVDWDVHERLVDIEFRRENPRLVRRS